MTNQALSIVCTNILEDIRHIWFTRMVVPKVEVEGGSSQVHQTT